ncbi:2-amino-3-ketobutyrate coenzyme A ligase [Mycolicibacterium aubagnense]
MTQSFLAHLDTELAGLKAAGLYKSERVISSMQSAEIEVAGEKVLNFCANNYLGLADNAELRASAQKALDRYGYGMASVRFICGTQEEHKQLEIQNLLLPRPGRHYPLRLLLRREWRLVRDAAR